MFSFCETFVSYGYNLVSFCEKSNTFFHFFLYFHSPLGKIGYFWGMEKDYLQKINLSLLQKDMQMPLPQIAELVDISPKAIYKWQYSRDDGGSRPTYDAIKIMKDNGASDMALFGIEPKREEPTDKEFAERVKQVLRSML